jgi:hypothetical protein
MSPGNSACDDSLCNASRNGTFYDRRDGIHWPNDLGLELRRHMQLDLREQVLTCTKPTHNEHILQRPVLGLDGNDLVPHQLQDSVHDRLETLEDFLVRKSHVAFFNPGLWEFSLNPNINGPFLAVVAEIGLYSVLKVHDTFGIHLPCSSRSIGQLHLPDLCTKDVAEIPIQRRRTATVSTASCALGNSEWCLFLNFIGNQIHCSTATVDNEDCVVDLQIQKTSLGTEHGGSFGLGNQC